MLSIRVCFVLWTAGEGPVLDFLWGSNKWRKPEGSRIVSRIVWVQWRPWSTMGKDSSAVAYRNRDKGRDGPSLVMEKQEEAE